MRLRSSSYTSRSLECPLTVEHESETASAKVWRLYGSKADKYDTELAETWKGQTDAMLIFVSAPYRSSRESLHLSR
jgi:hypothetical protein